VSESELAHAQSHIESVRFAEYLACLTALERSDLRDLCGGGCNREALCEGRWEDVCVAKDAATSPGSDAAQRAPADHIRALWQVERIHRNAEEVEDAQGYDFNPQELHRLFRAGTEAARQRCIQLAGMLGIPPRDKREDPTVRANLMKMCGARLPAELCQGSLRHEPGKRLELRNCGGPLPQRCTAVCDGASVQTENCPEE
jgi:hypothetical protein